MPAGIRLMIIDDTVAVVGTANLDNRSFRLNFEVAAAFYDKGVIDRKLERAMYTTFLASTFRTLRFGMTESHAKGMALQVNYLLDAGAFTVNRDGSFSVNLKKAKKGIAGLTRDLLTLQATGDYAGTKKLFDRLIVMRPQVQAVIDRLSGVPIDIRPRFVPADALARE